MNDNDFDREFEDEVRAEIQGSITPPATPMHLRERVERMAEQQLEGAGRRSFRPRLGFGAAAGRLAVVAIGVVLVAGTMVTLSWRGGGGTGSLPSDASTNPTGVAARSGDPAGTPGPTPRVDPRDVRLLDATADDVVFHL